MTLLLRSETQRRPGPLVVSLCLHGAAFVALVHAPAIELPQPSESEYKQAFAGKEEKLVWYKFKELPPVTPPKTTKDTRLLRAESEAKKALMASPKDAPKRDRMVWTPAPELVAKPLESPNLIAVKLPDPAPKAFVTPPDLVKPPARQPELAPEAPVLEAQAAPPPPVSTKLPPKTFVPPPPPTPKVAKLNQLEEAPPIAATKLAAQRKTFLPPPPVPRAVITPTGLYEPPSVAEALHGPSDPSLPAIKLPPRPFTAPTSGTGPHPTQGVAVDTPPQDLNVAIVGVNPVDKLTMLPAASSPAAFSTGPVVRKNGAVSEPGPPGINVPDLFVKGARDKPKDSKPDLLAQAYAAPTSAQTLRAAIRRGDAVVTAPEPEPMEKTEPGGAARVKSAPDARFTGREVFMMAIQMPNLTSASGSWLMWYSDRTAHEVGLAPIAPPVAHRKVDPKYVATAVEERVEGNVRLYCMIDREGKVSKVELVHGVDDRLNQSAQEALAKWEFYPATRHGEPLAVDVLVEIPFRLAPKPVRR